MCFYVFWERNMVRKERKNAEKDAQTAPKCLPFNLSYQEPIIGPGTLFEAQRTNQPLLVVRSGSADVNNFILMHFFNFDSGRAF